MAGESERETEGKEKTGGEKWSERRNGVLEKTKRLRKLGSD